MKKIEFRYLNTRDKYNLKWKWCSRVYEYPTVLSFLESIKTDTMMIHNTAAGYADGLSRMQFDFLDELQQRFQFVRNSDREATPQHRIDVFNIVTDKDNTQYDVVLNISVIEHLPIEQQITALDNLWLIVKSNGYLVLTFDLPAVDLSMIEKWCGYACEEKPIDAVNGANSIFPQPEHYANYNFILLILQKDDIKQ